MPVTVDLLPQLLEVCNRWLSHPVIAFLQFQGTFICILLAVGWAWSGIMRQRELDRQRCSISRCTQPRETLSNLEAGLQSVQGKASSVSTVKAPQWPAVSVILPVKGCRAHSFQVWRSQLGLQYDGPLEFLFVLDSPADPAYGAISAVTKESKGPVARIVVASAASMNSQKIHNIVTGVRSASPQSKYILCLDDDVILPPSALQTLVHTLESDPSAFMATGYPFDVPSPTTGILTYCMLSYHLPLVIAFSIRQRTSFVWGGCMLFQADSLRKDAHGIVKAWTHGGYSDDLIVASCCGEAGLTILCPSSAIFPQLLDEQVTLERYWNYLRRQLYVMDTYVTPYNRTVNHTMLALHTYLSWAFVLPCLTAGTQLVLGLVELALLPTQHVYDGPGTSWDWIRRLGGVSAPAAKLSLLAYVVAFASMALALRWMTSVVLSLFKQQSPQHDELSMECFNWLKVWLGFLMNNAILPLCMVYTVVQPHIDWSGVRYYKSKGRVVRVEAGPLTTCAGAS